MLAKGCLSLPLVRAVVRAVCACVPGDQSVPSWLKTYSGPMLIQNSQAITTEIKIAFLLSTRVPLHDPTGFRASRNHIQGESGSQDSA